VRQLLLLTLFAVTAHAADMSGHYLLRNVMEVGSELLLNSDGTFEFALAYGAADYSATGTWRTEGGAVILNTTGKDQPPFRLLRSAAAKKPGTRVWVLAPGGQPVPRIDVVIDTATGKAAARTSDDGSAEFPEKTAARSAVLRVAVYQVQAGPFELNAAHNDFYFEIDGDALARVPFKDERLTIDGTTLVMTYYGTDRAMRYEKQ
jgi:hypothetical protein